MKNAAILLALVIMFAISALSAHPAGNVTAGFNKENNLLTVSYNHKVRDNADHFIGEVVVLKNKKEIIRQKLGLQDSMEGGELIFKINDLKPKDKLDITTTCNKTGKKSFTLEIK
jgi:hypothetical protein